METDFFDLDLSLRPTYRSFWESEKRRTFLLLSPELSLRRSGSTRSRDGEEREEDVSLFGTSLDVRGTLREYGTTGTFLFGAADGTLNYDAQRTEEDSTRSDFDVRADVRLGLGVGRVRVVTPVIRALRVRERLRAVAPGASVSDLQVQTAARQLARRPEYQAIYDRPDKYFWREFFDAIGATGLTPFETYYVADVLREPVGVRREGAEFMVGTKGAYDRSLERTEREGQLVTRRNFERGKVGGFVRGRWYRNFTLRHQLGMDVEGTYTRFIDSQGPLDDEVEVDAEGQWLWVLADRVRLDTRLRARLRYLKDPRGQGKFRSRNWYALSSNLLVFVENSLRLTAGANVRYVYEVLEDRSGNSISEFRMGLQFHINYVLSRALQ